MAAGVRFGHWGFDRHRPGDRYGVVTHGDADLICVHDGEVGLHAGDPPAEVGRVAAAGGGSGLLLIPPGLAHTLAFAPDRPTRIFYLHFTGAVAGAPPARAWPRAVALPADDVVRPLLGHLIWLLQGRERGWQDQAACALGLVLQAACSGRCGRSVDPGGELPPLLEALAARVAAAWSGPQRAALPLDQLASAAGVSREHLCRACAAELGCGPAEALRLIRLQRAATQLARFDGADAEVAQVAHANGFASVPHFTRSFTATFGEPPARFRARVRAGGAWPEIEPPGVAALRRRIWELADRK